MKGILLKELYSLNAYWKAFIFMLLFSGVMSFFMDTFLFAPMMLIMYLILISMSLQQIDAGSLWDRYAVALPIKRDSIVGARYLFLVLAMLVTETMAFAAGAIIAVIRGVPGWLPTLFSTCGSMGLLFLFITSISIPVSYKFGAEKARFATLFIFLIPYLLVILLLDRLDPFLQSIGTAPTAVLAAGATVLAIGLYVASWRISTRIYVAKEF